MKSVRIGAGAGYSGDRIAPALRLIENGSLNYIVFECLAERTIALAQQMRRDNPRSGYDPMLSARIRTVLPACRKTGTRLISNMGAANPRTAANRICEIAAEQGLSGLRVSAIEGDDVLELFRSGEFAESQFLENGTTVSSISDRIVSANAYIGSEPVAECLAERSDVVIGGRIADPSLFLGPLVHEFGWNSDDWRKLGAGILVGHLLECAGHLTGGYFADPPMKSVPDIANLGFPYAVVAENGEAEFTKLEDSGGILNLATCKEQLLYEVHDPSRYLTPDVTADFSNVILQEVGRNRVRASGGGGSSRPSSLKVAVGYSEGFIGEGQITYAGTGAFCRAKLAIDIVRQQLLESRCSIQELRAEMIGVNSVARSNGVVSQPHEIRVRVAGRTKSAEEAEIIGATVESLYTNGPAAGGGATRSIRPVIAIASTLIPRELVRTQIHFEVTR
jgi:hypothetical protein